MINKDLDKIDIIDLDNLIKNSVQEGKTIDYKLTLPGNTDSDKKEFLADVSSFANTSGGDIIYGIKEDNGLAKDVIGLSITNIDEDIRKYDNLIQDGIEPRIQATIRAIKGNNKCAFIIRINKSWIGPHRVIFKSHDKFYARNSAGKYPLDTQELRTSFNLSDTLIDKIKRFRMERISALMSDNTPVPFYGGGKIALHLIPLESFSSNTNININSIEVYKLRPIDSSGWDHRINLEGLLTYSLGKDNRSHSYVQLYRNGIIEATEGSLLIRDKDRSYIPSIAYEIELMKSLSIYLELLNGLNINPPILIFLTLIDVKGYEMEFSRFDYPSLDNIYKIDRDILDLPETIIDNYSVKPEIILKPMFDLIWNACGFKGSLNFDENGNWKTR